MSQLNNKTAVITGASSGIGRAIAECYAKAGAAVVINYRRSQAEAEQVVAAIEAAGGKAWAVQADVSQQQQVDALLQAALDKTGQLDIWVNNAGADILTGTDADKTDAEKLQALLQVDLQGTIFCSWAAVAYMQEHGGGHIINMSWDQAMQGYAGTNPQMFAAVKAGVSAFSKSLARSVAPTIRVNVLAPGWIQTKFADTTMPRDYYEQRLQEIPLRRFGRPGEVAAAALFLASGQADYLTGTVLNIGGGADLG
ncbi:MAG: SDR family NAD(P)-dependent oxidoreductase [Gammaproteobacteria bacterium]